MLVVGIAGLEFDEHYWVVDLQSRMPFTTELYVVWHCSFAGIAFLLLAEARLVTGAALLEAQCCLGAAEHTYLLVGGDSGQ
jgi:hypothetical protein